ncbi:granulocyte-macrophage colony-stimulating factor receptor subunit alpha-like [Bufo gargarizans]|uniref:granulocyte-macrophage colony-stimulating factor receptor subunit alpha-like n=1 Tax=Bufo gargarizans TaxID=30331 RepID=UPI001CF3B163|nr:granulocyte-macrophage colony-stimulating factor receptor subunit alpha-like [Bufo gargarizans]
MVHSLCLVFFICIWFPLKTACNQDKTTEEENIVPLLKDFKINLSPGLINITWNCNITKSMEAYYYKVNLQKGHRVTLNVSTYTYIYKIPEKIEFTIHKGLSAQLLVFKSKNIVYRGETIIYMPEGKNNSAADNFACMIYNVYIMNCSWTVGKEAPEDTQYSLVLRQENVFIKCQDYRTDSFGRQVGCVLNRPNITFKFKVYVEVLGLSNQTSIQFFDHLYEPIHDVILDPPRNITLTYNSDELEIKWQKPETHDKIEETCFMYSIRIKHKGGIDIEETNEYVYKTAKFHQNEKLSVTMGAKWQDCSNYQEWSAWSEPHTIGYDSAELTLYHILTVLGVGTAIILIFILFLCYRFRIWKKLFPQVPKPSLKLFYQVEQKEKSEQSKSVVEIPFLKKDEDEFICSYVTEIPENL